MESEQILALYTWQPGICFRHPSAGVTDTTVVKTLHSQYDGEQKVRACRDCILLMEETRRRAAQQSGSEYKPGHAGEALA